MNLAHLASQELDVTLGKKGLAQNVDKREMTLMAAGTRAQLDMNKFYCGKTDLMSRTTTSWPEF